MVKDFPQSKDYPDSDQYYNAVSQWLNENGDSQFQKIKGGVNFKDSELLNIKEFSNNDKLFEELKNQQYYADHTSGIDTSSEDIKDGFKNFDFNNDGKIDFKEAMDHK